MFCYDTLQTSISIELEPIYAGCITQSFIKCQTFYIIYSVLALLQCVSGWIKNRKSRKITTKNRN